MRFRREASPLHAARGAAGGAWCCALAAAALAAQHPLVLTGILAVTLAAAVAADVGRDVARTVLFVLPLALLAALVNPFVTREGLTVFLRLGEVPPFGQLDLTVEAVVYGGLIGLRLTAVVAAFALFSAAVDPDEILRLFRRVSFRSALAASLAVRLVPVLARDGARMAEAQRCRPRAPEGTRARVHVLRAVATGALDRALDVAATLEVRGYATARRAGARRVVRPWSRHDL
ncbi:MAG TPA: energy-coupling factor transporter transmembrane component T, partial [Baekduia sp.]|nr:energy-coupling factor transporter transmembrane component T [Baekduia sp.]